MHRHIECVDSLAKLANQGSNSANEDTDSQDSKRIEEGNKRKKNGDGLTSHAGSGRARTSRPEEKQASRTSRQPSKDIGDFYVPRWGTISNHAYKNTIGKFVMISNHIEALSNENDRRYYT